MRVEYICISAKTADIAPRAMSSYQRLDRISRHDNDEDDDIEGGVVMSPIQTPQIPVVISSAITNCVADSSSSDDYTQGMILKNMKIKVLKGEQSNDITIPIQASVSQLKSLVESVYHVPVAQQRLVFKGKPLRPDEDSLASFNVTNNAVLHLFPLPATSATTPSASSATASADNPVSLFNLSYPNTRDDMRIPGLPPHLMRPIHFVPEVVQSIREVKMWCYILIITSVMDIFTNMSYLGSQGHAGRGLLDAVLNILQTVFSVVGLYVGQLGLRCSTTAEATSIKQYVYSLGALAVVNVILKAVWVVDVILLAKKSLRESHEEEEEEEERNDDGRNEEPGKGGGQYIDEPPEDQAEPMSDQSFMIYFSIQAVIMAMIAISLWVACVNRARAFQRVVRSYEGATNRA